MDNHNIARKLSGYANELARKQASLYRVRAYRRAAAVVQAQERPLTDIVAEQGRAGLAALPGIGHSLAFTIEALVRSGEFRTLHVDGDCGYPNKQSAVIMTDVASVAS
jgi:DNA polymerase/3'-5' exonuclease PolX